LSSFSSLALSSFSKSDPQSVHRPSGHAASSAHACLTPPRTPKLLLLECDPVLLRWAPLLLDCDPELWLDRDCDPELWWENACGT
jgi:hypothetical protein